MPRFDFVPTSIAGLVLVQRRPLEDDRGFLSRCYCAAEFEAAGVALPIAQVNHTLTRRKGTVRGMHYQLPPHSETKLVSCLRGAVFDVAVDLRRSSPTFLAWHGEVLSASNHRSLLIPKGFAHGLQALTDDCELFYLHSEPFRADAEAGLRAGDPRLAISWPMEITAMSERDMRHPLLDAGFEGLDA